MTYALIIQTQDKQNRVAARGISFTTWDNVAQHMSYMHPSVARRAYFAFKVKFADYVGLRPVHGYIVTWSDVPATLAGTKSLPPEVVW